LAIAAIAFPDKHADDGTKNWTSMSYLKTRMDDEDAEEKRNMEGQSAQDFLRGHL
jgi:hypothetical protein